MNFDVKVDGMYYGSVDDMDTSQQIFIFFFMLSLNHLYSIINSTRPQEITEIATI